MDPARMSDNPLDDIPSYDRVSLRAVVVSEGEDVNAALLAAGIIDPVSVPVVFGDDGPDITFGDAMTPNVTGVLEPDEQTADAVEHAPTRAANQSSPRAEQPRQRRPVTTQPSAFGSKSFAPVTPRGG